MSQYIVGNKCLVIKDVKGFRSKVTEFARPLSTNRAIYYNQGKEADRIRIGETIILAAITFQTDDNGCITHLGTYKNAVGHINAIPLDALKPYSEVVTPKPEEPKVVASRPEAKIKVGDWVELTSLPEDYVPKYPYKSPKLINGIRDIGIQVGDRFKVVSRNYDGYLTYHVAWGLYESTDHIHESFVTKLPPVNMGLVALKWAGILGASVGTLTFSQENPQTMNALVSDPEIHASIVVLVKAIVAFIITGLGYKSVKTGLAGLGKIGDRHRRIAKEKQDTLIAAIKANRTA